MSIQHMIIEIDNEAQTATARIDWANRPSPQDATEILQGFEFAGNYVEIDGDMVEVELDSEARADLQEIADEYLPELMFDPEHMGASENLKTMYSTWEALLADANELLSGGQTYDPTSVQLWWERN